MIMRKKRVERRKPPFFPIHVEGVMSKFCIKVCDFKNPFLIHFVWPLDMSLVIPITEPYLCTAGHTSGSYHPSHLAVAGGHRSTG